MENIEQTIWLLVLFFTIYTHIEQVTENFMRKKCVNLMMSEGYFWFCDDL